MVLAGTLFALLAAVWSQRDILAADVLADSTSLSEPDVMAPPASEVARAVFRHSVVPGGVYTANEVQAAVDRDSTVAAHYGQVTPAGLHPEKLSADELVYMSYRIGDQIYWTRHQVRLRQGETILSDGVNRIRARCGNCLSVQPMQPTADAEPDSTEFDAMTPLIPLINVEPQLIPSRVWAPISMPSGMIAGGLLPVPSSGGLFMPLNDMMSDRASLDGPLSDLTPSEPSRPGLGIFPDFPGERPTTGLPPLIGPPTTTAEHPGDFGTEENPPVREDPLLGPIEDPVPVPEPSTLLLLGGGITALLARRRCR